MTKESRFIVHVLEKKARERRMKQMYIEQGVNELFLSCCSSLVPLLSLLRRGPQVLHNYKAPEYYTTTYTAPTYNTSAAPASYSEPT